LRTTVVGALRVRPSVRSERVYAEVEVLCDRTRCSVAMPVTTVPAADGSAAVRMWIRLVVGRALRVAAAWRGAGAVSATVAGSSATTHTLAPRTQAPDRVAPPAAFPPLERLSAQRTNGSTGTSTRIRSRTEPRARLSSWRTAPWLAPRRDAISS
jgi:hypothetical protein